MLRRILSILLVLTIAATTWAQGVTYKLAPMVDAELDRIERNAGAVGPLVDAKWANSERNNYEVAAGETHRKLRLVNGRFVGIHHPTNGVAVDDLLVEDVELVGNTWWGSRPYEYRKNVVYRRVSVYGVEKEHAFYPTIIGFGTFPISSRPSRRDPSIWLDRCRSEFVGSQVFQLTGPRHLKGQQVGTAPNGTGFSFEDADTWGGPILVTGNYARAACLWGSRPSFAFSFRELKAHVVVDGLALDNRQFTNAWGGALFQGSKDFIRAAQVEHLIILQPNARYAPLQVERWGPFTMRNSAVYAENGKPVQIIAPWPGHRILIEDCEGNVPVHLIDANGVTVLGMITDRIDYTP